MQKKNADLQAWFNHVFLPDCVANLMLQLTTVPGEA